MKERIAVIVGGTGEIGKCVMEVLRNEGYYIICISSSPLSDNENSMCADYYVYDMSQPNNIDNCCDIISKKYGFIDCLVNIIGKNIRTSLQEITEEIWDDVINTNLKSVFFICRTFEKLFSKEKEGSIINFSSTAGIRALPCSPHYIVAKAGVITLTEYFAKVFAPKVRVNCIAPGFVLTEKHKPENYTNYNNVIERIPLHQMATVGDIANAVVYLTKSTSITGHTLVVDGGLIL